MAITYTEKDVLQELNDFLTKQPLELLYTERFINYTGKTRDTQKYYSEIICEELIKKDVINKLIQIHEIHRENSYKVASHFNGGCPQTDTNRKEEILAKGYFLEKTCFDKLGKVIDFQVPLKNKQDDKAGKIDLITYNENSNDVFLVELKALNSAESLLRAALEISIYYEQLKKDKFLNDYSEVFKGKVSEQNIKKAVLLIQDSKIANEAQDENRPKLRELLKSLDVSVEITDKTPLVDSLNKSDACKQADAMAEDFEKASRT